jgi:DNA-binding NtrC family response regulator
MSGNRKGTILLVDDDENIRETLKAILEQEGYLVDTAGDGAEAIRKSSEKLFHLAVVDMRLPDIMGADLLGKLKARTPKTRKVILTGYPSMDNAIDSVNEGADAYILKPVDAGVLLDSVSKQLRKREEEERYSDQKVTEFIETRAKGLDNLDSPRASNAKKS